MFLVKLARRVKHGSQRIAEFLTRLCLGLKLRHKQLEQRLDRLGYGLRELWIICLGRRNVFAQSHYQVLIHEALLLLVNLQGQGP